MLPRESATWWWKFVIFAFFILSEIIRFSDSNVNVFSSFPLLFRDLILCHVYCCEYIYSNAFWQPALQPLAGRVTLQLELELISWLARVTNPGQVSSSGLAQHSWPWPCNAKALFQISSALKGTETGTTTDERNRKEDKKG